MYLSSCRSLLENGSTPQGNLLMCTINTTATGSVVVAVQRIVLIPYYLASSFVLATVVLLEMGTPGKIINMTVLRS